MRTLTLMCGAPITNGRRDGESCQSATLTAAWKLSRLGATVTVGPHSAATASRVFKPLPVIKATTRSFGLMVPARASLASTATVTPPAVSAKMPSVRASRRMPSTISSSVTAATAPPERRTSSRAYVPSAGLPIASDLAMPLGFTGRMKSAPDSNAVRHR